MWQAIPLIEHLPEYKALEDEEGRKAAFAKYVKRQKVGVLSNDMGLYLIEVLGTSTRDWLRRRRLYDEPKAQGTGSGT